MKGQVFMIVSLFILLFLFLLRLNTQTVDLSPKDLFYEDFSNLKNEIIKTIDISILNQENLQNNLNDFIMFSIYDDGLSALRKNRSYCPYLGVYDRTPISRKPSSNGFSMAPSPSGTPTFSDTYGHYRLFSGGI